MAQGNWRSEHGKGYAVPAILETLLSDVSWKNDACPHFQRTFADGSVLSVWVEHRMPSARESSAYRYTVTRAESYDSDDATTIIETDSREIMLATLLEFGIGLVCSNCGQWQHAGNGNDCFNRCKARGFSK